MGKDTELFKAAKTGNNSVLERAFAPYLKKQGQSHGFGSSLSSIRHKFHPNLQDGSGYTLLHHATLQGQRETVSLLLKCGASTTIADSSGSCPLHLAAWKGDIEIVKMLVCQGPSRANVNQQSDSDDTALHLASQYDYSDVVEFLLQRHADPLQRNSKCETPLDLASQYGHLDTVHILVSHCPEILRLQREDTSPLHLAARNGHTVVALSLINAGISVNTVREHGTALHEAAMCGKVDTVQLLLDKGVDLDLKDREGRTVLEMLKDYPAAQAQEIKMMIQNRTDSNRMSSSSLNPPDVPRVVAIANTDYSTLHEDACALTFSQGDVIIVEGRRGPDVFEGSARGRCGSFLASDVSFFTEQGDQRVKVDSAHIFSNGHSPSSIEAPPGANKTSLSTKRPYEHLPGFPLGSPVQEEEETLTPINAHHNRLSIEVIEKDRSYTVTPALSPATTSNPSKSATLPSSGRHLKIAERAERKRMSKKEKIFQLSKDDGSYAELKPINPHEAQKEFGNTLKLKSVVPGPQMGGDTEEGEVEFQLGTGGPENDSTVVENGEEAGFQGSYYVLEVGNFEPSGHRVEVSPPRDDTSAGEPQKGYYMLDINNFDTLPQNAKPSRSTSSLNQQSYKNASTPDQGSKVNITPPSPKEGMYDLPYQFVKRVKQVGPNPNYENVSSATGSRLSSYENVPPTTSEAANRLSYSVPPPFKDRRHTPERQPVATDEGYAIVSDISVVTQPELIAKQRGRGSRSKSPVVEVASETSQTGLNEPSEVAKPVHNKTNWSRREEVYEAISIGKKSAVNGSSEKSHDTQSDANSATKGLTSNTTIELNTDQDTGQSSKVIDSHDNPFAGLVISASRQLEDQLSATSLSINLSHSEGGAHRGRAETLWDDERVQKEWSQIDTLLRDVSGTIATNSDLPTSPTQAVSHTTSSTNEPPDLFHWLREHNIAGYASALESSGFDNISFLSGNILAQDDLEDIGISVEEDQLSILAAVSLLPAPPLVRQASSMHEWLRLLELEHLSVKFDGFSLERLSKLWDIELTSVVGIELLGYRKRLQYGISEIRVAHPEWEYQNMKPLIKQTHPSTSAKQSPALTDRVSLIKDYRNIQSSRHDTDVETRSPAEAQNIPGGRGQRTPKLPSDSWKHPNTALIKESVNYKTKYLGSVIVVSLHGNRSAEEACLRLRTSTEGMQKFPEIILSISWKGVKFVDSQSKMVVSTHAIRDISCCSPDIEDERVFAYITKEKQSGMNYSHVFMAPTKEVADEIRMTIGQAFEICYQKVMKARRISQESQRSSLSSN